MVLELVVGIASNSLALMGDAGHMLADVGALALALGTEKLAERSGGPGHTFGYRRAPTLGAFGNALSMIVVAGVLIHQAIYRMAAPPDVASLPVLVAGGAGLIVNVASAVYLVRAGGDSHNIKGALLHMIGDALGSVGVIVSAVVIATTGWVAIDPIVTLLIAVLIAGATWPLLRDSTRTLLEISPAHVDVEGLRAAILDHPAATCIEDLHVWELDAGYLVLTASIHVLCPDLDRLEGVRQTLKQELVETWKVSHVTLELVLERDHDELTDGCSELG